MKKIQKGNEKLGLKKKKIKKWVRRETEGKRTFKKDKGEEATNHEEGSHIFINDGWRARKEKG